MPFYAVAKGKTPGIFSTWPECQDQIVGFKGAVYKKFSTEEEASQFVQERGTGVVDKRSPSKKKEDNVSSTKNSSDKKDSSSDSTSLKRRSSNDEVESSKPKKIKLIEEVRDGNKFSVDDDGFLIVYTDGACGFNGKHGAKAGIGVYFGKDHKLNVSEPVRGRATNNTAEIQAAAKALEITKKAGFDKVILNTDSQFMINCSTSWMPNWKKNDWKKKDGSEVINKEDLIKLDKGTEGLLVKWNYVKAHDGLVGNEAADKLAREGSKLYKKEEAE